MYPIIRLPREFQELAGSTAEIYQTTHECDLAFLIKVVSRGSEKLSTGSASKAEPLHGEGRAFESPRAHRLFSQSGARIKPGAEDGEVEELHNSGEKLCNFGVADNDKSLVRIMTDRYIDEEGNECA